MQDMQWCQAYAMDNKMIMRDLMIDIVNEFTGHFPDLEHSINIQQNYCNCKWCCYKDPLTGDEIDKKLWVTWKGATSAQAGQCGIIPGSMRTGSCIIR